MCLTILNLWVWGFMRGGSEEDFFYLLTNHCPNKFIFTLQNNGHDD